MKLWILRYIVVAATVHISGCDLEILNHDSGKDPLAECYQNVNDSYDYCLAHQTGEERKRCDEKQKRGIDQCNFNHEANKK